MRYVIIGNSAAAVGAVEGIRSVDSDGEIILISQEPYHTYSRPLISYYLAGKATEANMYYRPRHFYEENRVKAYLGTKVSCLNVQQKELSLEPNGMKLSYDKLLVASGGRPVVPPAFEGERKNVFHFHCWDDIKNIDFYMQSNSVSKSLVIGGGLVGLKAAESLIYRKQGVTVVEAGNYLLNTILDEEAALLLKRHLLNKGVNITTGNKVVSVSGREAVEKVRMEDGSELETDMVILAAGVRPNFEWLADSGVRVDVGIVVGDFMETSLEGVFAAGDVAQAYDLVYEEKRVVPILPNAYLQGRTAGMNMAGVETRYPGGIAFNSIPILGLNIVTAGLSTEKTREFSIFRKQTSELSYRKLVCRGSCLVGFIMMGDIQRCGIYRYLIREKIDLSGLRDRLLEGDFGLLDLPEGCELQRRGGI